MAAPKQEDMAQTAAASGGVAGTWNSCSCCACWYHGTHEITEEKDEIKIVEVSGTCCVCVPNCLRKTVTMKKTSDVEWEGRSGCKKVSLKKVSDNELAYMSSDGLLKLSR
eukprot:TRINITY_DN48924_c0_g1_i1.p1 TRINITY_DN48924_c0_g1~~TRINITY_DN48924_c0_g1_i1.p1  ORF type:complete len:110 (-),score=16.95 TRINITY_DN48924_c0_g1_i1:229-558(-)